MNEDSKTSGKKIAFISIHLSMHKLQNIYMYIYSLNYSIKLE